MVHQFDWGAKNIQWKKFSSTYGTGKQDSCMQNDKNEILLEYIQINSNGLQTHM